MFAPLAAWRRSQLDDAALDDAISPKLESTRANWDRPRRLREAKARGDSIAAFVRNERREGHGHIQLIKALIKAFGLGLSVAKSFVGLCGDAQYDAELDRSLEQSPKP